ncbi:hypothetical protein Syun_027740 [Stephania yunnanensis]|uniref:Uncharacterized protein n=1 Tax=Stephania yunnanensis TaxID=152371 RepID=A0AAP0EQ08_9MAGN
MGPPCRRPRCAKILPIGLPFIITEKFEDLRHPLIHRLHLGPKPLFFITKSRNPQSIRS